MSSFPTDRDIAEMRELLTPAHGHIVLLERNKVIALLDEIDQWRHAREQLRDAVLNVRGSLAETPLETDPDTVNAVLDEIDSAFQSVAPALQEPSHA